MLAEPEVSTADRMVLTGDITAGPQPTQVLDLLTSLGHRIIWISGNADRELIEYRRGQRHSIPDPVAPWAAEQGRCWRPRSKRSPVGIRWASTSATRFKL